ncbi:MAG: tRNA (N(6)-L-threonylcarbamoyladenosine(37)-C(2))-methylthiotransferase MtaB [Anaerolineae bacterium]|nr:tRNA (N(6)-L-threonylcarbamoyladenosine(37)-C(2))-methylthiotransferase MtaB [Anaerolineae bacterium]
MRVYLETTGCRLNQSEIETLARQFQRAGHTIVESAKDADLCVVNTCAVTREATRSSRNMIRRLHRENERARIVATGCYAHLSPGSVSELPGVKHIINNLDKENLVPLVLDQDPAELAEIFDREPLAREATPGSLGRTRAFVKVQDGCNNRCTFCVTTIARGKSRSRCLGEVVREIQALAEAGYQEAVLTGVHLGSYGHDLRRSLQNAQSGLDQLVRAILTDTDIPRLRLSSLEPWDIAPDFFTLWQNPRLCRHLHLPLQSGCDTTLQRMARRTSQASFRALVEAARAHIPDLAISTDVITGFPGETDDEFAVSLAFIREMDFMKLHVFRYSARSGTVAAQMSDQVPLEVSKARSAQLLALSDDGAQRFWARFIGREMPVLWEQVTGASEVGSHNAGLTDNYIRVEMIAPDALTNTISTVQLVDLTERGMMATPVDAPIPQSAG